MAAKATEIEDLKDERVPTCLYWSCERVGQWVEEELGFPCYKDCFVSNRIDGRKLILIDASTLPKLGVNDFEHIKVISKAIRENLGIQYPDWDRRIYLPPRESLDMYLEKKSISGTQADETTYAQFMLSFVEAKWKPPLSNHCLLLPHH